MSRCQHFKRIGDNYGVTCQSCGAVLEGYGYGGFLGGSLTGDERCLHVWDKSDPLVEECQYCFTIRDRKKKAN